MAQKRPLEPSPSLDLDPDELDAFVVKKFGELTSANLLFYALWQLFGGRRDFQFQWIDRMFRDILNFVFTSKAHALLYTGQCQCHHFRVENCVCSKEYLGFFARSYIRLAYETWTYPSLGLQLFHGHFMYVREFYNWHFFCLIRGFAQHRWLPSHERLVDHGLAYFCREDGKIWDTDYHPDNGWKGFVEYVDNTMIDLSSALGGHEGHFKSALFQVFITLHSIELPIYYTRKIFCFLFSHLPRDEPFEGIICWAIQHQYPISELKFLYVEMRIRTADIFRKLLPHHAALNLRGHFINPPNEPVSRTGPFSNPDYIMGILETFSLDLGWKFLEICRAPDQLVYTWNHAALRRILDLCGGHSMGSSGYFPRGQTAGSLSLQDRIYDAVITKLAKHYPGLEKFRKQENLFNEWVQAKDPMCLIDWMNLNKPS